MDVYDPYMADQAKIQQQMRVADLLQRQGMQSPQGQMVSGHYVRSAPTQYAARLAASLMGKRAMDESTGALGDLTARASADRQAEIAAALGGGDPAQRLQAALSANSPEARAIGTSMIDQQNLLQKAQYEAQLREAEAIRRAGEAKTLQEQRDAAALERARLAAEARKAAAEAGGGAPDPYYTYQPVTDASGQVTGIARLDARGGPPEMLSVDGMSGFMRPQDNPGVQKNLAAAKTVGKETGIATASLADQSASLPRLEQVVSELSDLGKTATYTIAGQAEDSIQRQAGMDPGADAVARTAYISKVDNEILPLLRQTFGAQFTQKEGESLKATLGDPNKSPVEKDAVLRSFIESKRAQIEVLKRRTAVSNGTAPVPTINQGQSVLDAADAILGAP